MLSHTDEELQAQAEKLQEVYASDLGEEFVMEVRSFRREFRLQLQDFQSVMDVLELLVSTHMLSSMPELGTACVLFCTLPVTVSSAEHSFSKLKLIKSYLRSTSAEDRLDSLAPISIENEEAAQLQLDAVVDRSSEAKLARNISKTHTDKYYIIYYYICIMHVSYVTD